VRLMKWVWLWRRHRWRWAAFRLSPLRRCRRERCWWHKSSPSKTQSDDAKLVRSWCPTPQFPGTHDIATAPHCS